jgi:hypothetical protein
MSAPTVDAARLEDAFARAEGERQAAAEAERAAYQRWMDAFAEYHVARDEATDAWTEWMDAVGP